jgi:hypothetical protein
MKTSAKIKHIQEEDKFLMDFLQAQFLPRRIKVHP